MIGSGSWTLAEEQFARGDPGFVAELRSVHTAERLAGFASKWYADRRPFARAALLDYLSLPLNCFRHEPLVKRLFKLAENAGDDQVMGAFAAALDRAIRRQRKTFRRYRHETFTSQAEAAAAANAWAAEGWDSPNVNQWSGRFFVNATRSETAVVIPGRTTMPRPKQDPRSARTGSTPDYPDSMIQRYEKRFVLFTPATRRYLRRRAWRYFRKLGKTSPDRYATAVTEWLVRYTDADTDSDIHLLDCWSLVHALFHNSPALESSAKGWEFAPGASLANLAPAPYLEAAWIARPEQVLGVVVGARSRAVRRWAVWMLRQHHEAWLKSQPVQHLLELTDHDDPDVASLGFDLLEQSATLDAVHVAVWLARLDGGDLAKLDRLSNLLSRQLAADRVPVADAVKLAAHRSKPVATLGLTLLRQKSFTSADADTLLPLVQAECGAVRLDIVRWVRSLLVEARPEWVLEFLDSKFADVRAEGWEWFQSSALKDDTTVWYRLIESPYEDIRTKLAGVLDEKMQGADPETVRRLWATMLLNVVRGGRQKPGVVAKIVSRLASHADESDRLLPLLAVSVRSLRGPEFRAGLAAVVRLSEEQPNLLPAIRERFVELEL